MIILLPIAILLTMSFFVLVMVSKIADKSLKIFGWVLCVVLWLFAALIVASGITACVSGPYGGYGKMTGQCQLPGSRGWQSGPYHMWKNKSYHKGMFDDTYSGMMAPHRGLMMEGIDNPMADLDDEFKCPVAEREIPEQEPEAEPDTKK